MSAASVETQDERSADEVREAKEATLASDRGEFIEGVEQGKFVGTKIANALGDVAGEVREAALPWATRAMCRICPLLVCALLFLCFAHRCAPVGAFRKWSRTRSMTGRQNQRTIQPTTTMIRASQDV